MQKHHLVITLLSIVGTINLFLGAYLGWEFGPVRDHGHTANVAITPTSGTEHHMHQMKTWTGEKIPRVTFTVTPDPKWGYNLHLTTENYLLESPTHTQSGNTDIARGHAHLFIDDVKVTRLYGEDLYLPAAWLPSGWHQVRVDLNTHNHETYLVGNDMVDHLETIAVP